MSSLRSVDRPVVRREVGRIGPHVIMSARPCVPSRLPMAVVAALPAPAHIRISASTLPAKSPTPKS